MYYVHFFPTQYFLLKIPQIKAKYQVCWRIQGATWGPDLPKFSWRPQSADQRLEIVSFGALVFCRPSAGSDFLLTSAPCISEQNVVNLSY